MAEDFWYPSCGEGKLHGICWRPEGEPVAVVQIVHGIADFAQRYQDFAQYLNERGFLVVAEDHMGHGQSVEGGSIQGYFHGGWFAAVEDTYRLLQGTRKEFPEIPYILFGHSMGSFMTRTILCKYPDSGIQAAVLCGTGWMPDALLPGAEKMVDLICKQGKETLPNPGLEKLVFGNYNARVEHPRTQFDWVSRDKKQVDAYIAHPRCGFTPTAGLMRELIRGVRYIQNGKHLKAMKKELPVLFIAGGDDPVGNYGKGVRHTAEAFRKAGVQDVTVKIYPLDRHEILNEINRSEVFEDAFRWMESKIGETVE